MPLGHDVVPMDNQIPTIRNNVMHSSGILRCANGQSDPDVSRQRNAFFWNITLCQWAIGSRRFETT